MSKEKRRVPKLRFPGFTEDWEQRKLGDVADVRDGTHDSPKFYNDGFPLVTSKNLKDGSIDFSDCSFISKQDFDEINKRSKVDSGDILFGMIGTIGNPAIVEHTGFAIKNVALIKEGIIVNNRFIYHLLSSKVFDNYIARENAGGTQKFIALNQIRNFIFLAPTLEEQNKIIELLDYISQTITLHQRKLNNLKLKRKALLQKLFPKNGEGYPELRFPGFTDAWEQRKLGECIDISTGYPFDSQDFNENGEYLVITNGNIQENTPFVLNNVGNRIDLDDSLKKYILDIDDLLITMDGTVGRVAIVVNNKLVLAQRVCRIKSNEPYYIYQLLSKNNFIQSMNKIGHGGTIKHISLSEISEYQDFYPKSQKERIKISTVLTNCDKLITLHQRKLKHLQIQKKSLLQKLFV